MSDDTTTSGPKQLLGQLQQLWGRSPKGRKLVVAGVVLAVIGAIAYMTLRTKEPGWTAVGDGVSPDEAQELYAALVARDIPARIKNGTVEVQADRASEARAVATSAGVLHGGAGLESFESTKLGQSAFAEQVNYRRAMQHEMERSIVQLVQIEGARVHIAFGKRSPFKDQSEPPTASVVLRLHPGQILLPEQVRGVRGLVAGSIEGMKPDGVAIVDNRGNLLDGADPASADPKAAAENAVAGRVRSMIERMVGKGHVQVVVTAEMDTRKVSETEEIFDKDRAAIRSESRTLDGVDAKTIDTLTGGVAGTQGNMPGSAAPTTGGGANPGASGHIQETKNYEVSRIVRQIQNPDATVKKLHVAVLVDQKLDAEGKPVARTADEVAELNAIATQAAGLDNARGDTIELRSVPFAADEIAVEPTLPTVAGKPWWLTYAIGGGAGLIALLALFIIMKKRGKKPAPVVEAPAPLALPAPVAVLERALDAGREPEAPALPEGPTMHEQVTDAVRADVERTAYILTAWLHEPVAAPKAATK
jgi:flagellar M-ring protein FliF